MKLPYIKIYTADLLAAGRNLTDQQVGRAILGICELAFENDTAYLPDSRHEEVLFDMLTQWKEEATASYQQNKKKIKKARSVRWQKQENSVGQSQKKKDLQPAAQHTETETKTDTETQTDTQTETETISLISSLNGREKERDSLCATNPLPAEFVDQVIERFEDAVTTPVQRSIFVRNNRQYLQDILAFCDHDIALALQTISVCSDRLQKGGLTGGYSAVCRNLPEYYEKARAELRE